MEIKTCLIKKYICLIKIIAVILSLFTLGVRIEAYQGSRGQGVVKIKVEEGKQVDLYEGSYALVIGVSQYQQGSGWSSLSGVKDDVVAVERALINQGFQVDKVLDPSGSKLRQSIDKFIDDYGFNSNNRLLIYYAGHGYTGKAVDGREMGYVVPMDAPDPDKMAAQFNRVAISMKEIINYAERIQSKHAMFLFDSCFSGTLFKSRDKVPPTITSKIAKPVRQFITAGDANQPVPDQSQFRRQFIAGLEGDADLNKDGYVTGSELGIFLEEKVTDYSNRAQTPQWGKINNPDLNLGDFVFALSKSSNTSNKIEAGNNATDKEEKFWAIVEKGNTVEEYEAYLKKYPNGDYLDIAKARIAKLRNKPTDNGANNPTISKRQSKIALLIGNQNYKDAPLSFPRKDVEDIGQVLKERGFDVITKTNLSKVQMEQAIAEFSQISVGGIALFYYSGLGIETEGKHYLIPIDVISTTQESVMSSSINLQVILSSIKANDKNTKIVILDDCRNDPFSKNNSHQTLFNSSQFGPNLFIAFAASPGQVASDDPAGKNGMFTGELIKQIKSDSEANIEILFKRTNIQVNEKTNGRQTPVSSSSLTKDFSFKDNNK